MFGRFGKDRAPDTTEELEQEIQELLEEGEEQGLISSHEEQLISRIFDFRETEASEIMTPSAEVVRAELGASLDDLVRLVVEEGFTRIPIYEGNPDNIIGILHVKDLLRLCHRSCGTQDFDLRQYLNPAYFIPESKPITDLLKDFQAKKTHMAIVTDEFGGVRGLVTLEDIIEEIVGEIDDEYDQDEEELRVLDEATILVQAKIEIEKVEAHFQVELPEGPYESVGGFVIHRLGRIPQNGAVVEASGLEFKVVSADRRRIQSVRIRRLDR